MSYLVALGVVALFGALVWHRLIPRPGSQKRRTANARPNRKHSRKERNASVKSNFHAVTIEHRQRGACDAVRAIAGRIYLSGVAPALPLDDCTAQTCQCRYIHHEDQRREDRRRFHHLEEGYLSSLRMRDRRVSGERRAEGRPSFQ